MTSSDWDRLAGEIDLSNGGYALLLGAGISASAGVPLATVDLPGLPSIATEAKLRLYQAANGVNPCNIQEADRWFRETHPEMDPRSQYSFVLDLLSVTELPRRIWLQKFFEGKKPGVAHNKVAELAARARFDYICTPNFDHLLEEALRKLNIEPSVMAPTGLPPRGGGPVLMKLHGDYRFGPLANLKGETQRLHRTIHGYFSNIVNEQGLIVVGYGGADESIMRPIRLAWQPTKNRNHALLWVLHTGSSVPQSVEQLRKNGKGTVRVLECDSADAFFDELAGRLSRIRPECRTHRVWAAASPAYAQAPLSREELSQQLGRSPDTVHRALDAFPASGHFRDGDGYQPEILGFLRQSLQEQGRGLNTEKAGEKVQERFVKASNEVIEQAGSSNIQEPQSIGVYSLAQFEQWRPVLGELNELKEQARRSAQELRDLQEQMKATQSARDPWTRRLSRHYKGILALCLRIFLRNR